MWCICGAVDFALVEPIVAGFATMNGAYVPKEGQPEEPPEAASRPFSAHRRGFVVSEGAGCIVLATEAFARDHGLDYRIAIAGWSMTSDAHHFVAPHLDTVRRCIRESLQQAGVAPGDVDAVNAHATATRVGDKVEYEALREVFGADLPPVTANKSLTGHAMGASSAIESVLAFEGMLAGMLPPTINYRPDPELPLDCVAEGARRVDQSVRAQERLRVRRLQHLRRLRAGEMTAEDLPEPETSMRAPLNRKVYVVGYDVATALGPTLASTWERAVRGEAGFRRVTRCATDSRSNVVGEIPDWHPESLDFVKPQGCLAAGTPVSSS